MEIQGIFDSQRPNWTTPNVGVNVLQKVLGNTKQLGAVDFGNFGLGQNLNYFWYIQKLGGCFKYFHFHPEDSQSSMGWNHQLVQEPFLVFLFLFWSTIPLMSECGVTFNAINFYEEVRHPRRSSWREPRSLWSWKIATVKIGRVTNKKLWSKNWEKWSGRVFIFRDCYVG